MTPREKKKLATGLSFLAPNILGFLAFTVIPLAFSLVMAFSDWDLRQHNMFSDESVSFIGIDNFLELFAERDFFKFLGNTLFFMIGIPFGVAASLFAAVLLSQEMSHGSRQLWLRLVGSVGLFVGAAMLLLVGCGATAMTILVCGLAGTVLVSGAAGGRTVYRTLFYFPHFTAGVATFLLWKKLYSPHGGPINNALAPVLQGVSGIVSGIPDSLVSGASWPCALAMCAAVGFGARGLRRAWRDGEVGWLSMTLGCLLLLFPVIMTPFWMSNGWAACVVILAAVAAFGYLASGIVNKRSYTCVADGGIGFALISCGALMIAAFFMLGIGNVFWHLPVMNADGLEAPEWLSTSSWAKPSIMLMGFWMAIGSNNMLLYLAGLSNIPVALYEAAEIDGASRLQRFWHVTWPQLAPVTFFILVMAMIHSLQGGFEMARTMTEGGPAGSTTTLSYYIYTEGFVSGRLGYASAISWALFALIFCVTMFNWKFGSRYTND